MQINLSVKDLDLGLVSGLILGKMTERKKEKKKKNKNKYMYSSTQYVYPFVAIVSEFLVKTVSIHATVKRAKKSEKQKECFIIPNI